MGPLIPQAVIDPAWNNVIGIVIGIFFGFILESSGFSSSRKLAGVFYGYDFTVIKVFMTAVSVAMVGLLYFNYFGWIDISMVYINPLFLQATIVGGVIMGFGFLMGGYCPGTSFCGAMIGKIDAIVYTGGMFLGVLLFSEAFPLFEGFYTKGSYGGLLIQDVLGISPGVFVFAWIVMYIGFLWMIYLFRNKFRTVEL